MGVPGTTASIAGYADGAKPWACIAHMGLRITTCSPGAQAELRKEAAASAIEEQLKDKEATEADNAANLAKLAEHEALVRPDARSYCHLARAQMCRAASMPLVPQLGCQQ